MEKELGPWAKSVPSWAWGMTDRELIETQPRRDSFATPLLTIDRAAMRSNMAVMQSFADREGVVLAPHGKTTMAPQLWRELLNAGAWGLTVATGWQAQVARSEGITRLVLANLLLDPGHLRWLGVELADPDFEFVCWVDSVDAVEAMRPHLADAARPVDVVLEVGAAGGRTGARSREEALRIARAVEAAPELRLAGVGGYEGSYGTDRAPQTVGEVRRYLDEIVALHDELVWERTPIVTAGGSAYPDLVADAFAPLRGQATLVLRSGAYQLHDEGFYSEITPVAELRSAIHAWTRVLSRPEQNLALLDGGKRDLPYDLGLPTTPFGTVEKVNDQHAYLRVAEGQTVRVGDVVRLGLSHPCTAFDKWRLIPMIDSADAADPVIVDLVRTVF